ncbi:protein NDNF-like [Discoglossus pictus]
MMEKVILALILWIPLSSQNYVGRAWSPLKAHPMIHVRQRLPIGHRVDGFLPVDKPARYYFAVNGSHNSITIRVTPCESPLYWTLSFQPSHDHKSGDAYGYYSRQLDPQQHWDTQKLFSFQGNGEESFSVAVTSGGFYLLDLISLESDTSFQVFAWDNRNQAGPLPQLPSDPRVDIISVKEDKVELSWKPSLGTTVGTSEFEYCVFVNKHYNFKTLCATELNTKRQQWDKQVDKSRKFGNVKMETHKNSADSSRKTFKTHILETNVNNDLWDTKTLVGGQKMCVGNWFNATISGLKPKTLYYFDVFVINPKDGTSIAYTGTFAETKAKPKTQVQHLHNEEMVNLYLKSKGLRILNMDMSARGSKWLFVHSCLHKVHLQIISNGKIIVSQSLQGAHNFKLIGNPKHNYVITLKSSRGGPGLVKLFATTSQNHLPFPNLSPDINLSMSNKSCSSVTMSWAGNGQGTKYCIYARHLEQNLDLKLIHKHQNSCLSTSTRSRAEKVFCKQGGPQTLTEEQITELKPGKAYLLDLYFIGTHNDTIKFPSHVVRTEESCT